MDALAADGVVYEQAFSSISVTGPSFVTLMTGMHPGRHGVLMNSFRGQDELPAEAVTLAERFKEMGYRTGAFVSGFTLRPSLGLDQGFSTYDVP
jgi:iduronate 2-sulfatase